MGVTISKRYSFNSSNSFSTKRFVHTPYDSFYFFFLKRLKFNIVANGKMQNCQYLGNIQS